MEMSTLDRHVLAVGFGQSRQVSFCSFSKTHVGFSTCRQRQASCARLTARSFNKLFGLAASDALTLASDNAMNSLPVNHHINTEHCVAICNTLEADSMFSQTGPRAKRSH